MTNERSSQRLGCCFDREYFRKRILEPDQQLRCLLAAKYDSSLIDTRRTLVVGWRKTYTPVPRGGTLWCPDGLRVPPLATQLHRGFGCLRRHSTTACRAYCLPAAIALEQRGDCPGKSKSRGAGWATAWTTVPQGAESAQLLQIIWNKYS